VNDAVDLGTTLGELAHEDDRPSPRLAAFDAVEARLAADVRAGRLSPFVRTRFRTRAASLQYRLAAADAREDEVARAATDLERELRAGATTALAAARPRARPASAGARTATKDVVIVGGGIVGLAAARQLARAGVRVVVIERGEIGGEASGRNGGQISPGIDATWAPLAKRALDLWPDFARELGDIDYQCAGGLYVVMESDPIDPVDVLEYRRERGFVAEALDASACRRLLPSLTDRIKGGVFSPRHGQVDPVKTMRALARSARACGVDLWSNEEVTVIDVSAGAFRGVRTPRRHVAADVVLIAAGAWSGALARQAGVDLPVSPRRIQIIASEPTERMTDTLWGGNGLYSRQNSAGELHFGAEGPPWDPSVETFERRTTEPTLRRIARRMVELTPGLRGLRAKRAWSGIIGPSADGQPIIDVIEEPSGLALATGFGGNGFGTGPASGEAIAELILTAPTSVDTTAMRLERFRAPS